eukprot:Gb_41783 [translate_table: standard]
MSASTAAAPKVSTRVIRVLVFDHYVPQAWPIALKSPRSYQGVRPTPNNGQSGYSFSTMSASTAAAPKSPPEFSGRFAIHLEGELELLGQFCVFWSFWRFYGPSKPSTRSSPSFWIDSGSSAAQETLYKSLEQVHHYSGLFLALLQLQNHSISSNNTLE